MPINMSGPVFQVLPPAPSQLTVVPVQGPVGPQGPPGDTAQTLAFTTTVTNQALVQVNHGLAFKPGGIICIDTNGVLIDYGAISYPAVGIVEITFGFPFTGTVYLS